MTNKRRTRKDKVDARHYYSYQPEAVVVNQNVGGKTVAVTKIQSTSLPMLLTERRYVISDLMKTLLFSVMMLMIQFAIYRYWNL
jgi:hypothetical protein